MSKLSQRNVAAAVAIGSAFGFTLAPTALHAQQPVGRPGAALPSMAQAPAYVQPNGFSKPADPPPVPDIRQSYDGIDFLGSNCGCLPPDTNAAVGNNFVVETVNVQIRVFDKKTGAILLDKSLASFFGAPSGGDVYVVYDDIANRWYVNAFDSDIAGLFLAVSQSGDPTGGWNVYDLRQGIGGFPDYAKPGFNRDAIFISYNDFRSGGAAATVVSIDKKAILAGTLKYYVSRPLEFQFRAMPPAQMHADRRDDDRGDDDRRGDDDQGGVEWFVSTDGIDTGGTNIRVWKMTNYLSNSPTFTLTRLAVMAYSNARRADQPNGIITTFPNTTTYQVQYHRGHLVTAMASALSADGFQYPKGLYYQIDVSTGTPTLLRQGVIDPGPGVAVQMPSVDEDSKGSLGLTWFESSQSEYMSMWVGTILFGKTLPTEGIFASSNVTPNAGFMYYNFRIGDYSTTVLDKNRRTFWSANEYVGQDGLSDIWRTHLASFRAGPKDEEQCEDGGWAKFGFKNKRQCTGWVREAERVSSR
jgi:hypothetical protein